MQSITVKLKLHRYHMNGQVPNRGEEGGPNDVGRGLYDVGVEKFCKMHKCLD